MTAGKNFQIRYVTPCPALEAALYAQPIIWYFAVPFGRPPSFACAIHMYTPIGGKAPSVPLGASPCSPWEPQGAAPARWCGAVFLFLPACRVPHRAVSCGLCRWRAGAAVRCLAVRVVRLGLWCRGNPSGAAGWARRNTPVFAGMSWRARGSRVASPWSLAWPWWESGGKEYWSVLKPPSRPLTLLTFWAAGNVSLAPFSQVTCAEYAPASQAFNFRGGGARRSQRRTYPLILALEGNVLDNFLITFPWSSVQPWVLRVWLALGPAHHGSALRERRVRLRDRSVLGPVPVCAVAGLRGSGERGPRPGDVGGILLVSVA